VKFNFLEKLYSNFLALGLPKFVWIHYSSNPKLLRLYNWILNLSQFYVNAISEKIEKKRKRKIKKISLKKGLSSSDLFEDLILKLDSTKFLAKQMHGSSFNRMDTIVRYLAIENYYNKNDYGFKLYNKMQFQRKFESQKRNNYEKHFRKLIQDIENYGYNSSSSILIDKNQQLLDGSHRLASALYYKEKDIPINISKETKKISFEIDWFKKKGFTSNEIDLILHKKHEIFKELGIYFVVILWPPVEKYFNEIEDKLSKAFKIIASINIKLNKNLEEFVRKIYAVDDIAEWKVDKKLNYMGGTQDMIRVLYIEIPNPRFRKKKLTNRDISTVVEETKRRIRNFYAQKIRNYYFDNVIHISDNYWQSRKLMEIINSFKSQ
jgi:hypothetical protein